MSKPTQTPEDTQAQAETQTPAGSLSQWADDELVGLEQPENPLPPMALADLPEALRAAVDKAGWPNLMPVQSLALPYLLAQRDIMVQSRTGSGKTGAYLLPALSRLDPDRAECQALVLVPTRELALQVMREAEVLFEGTGLRPAAVYGGVGYAKQREALQQGAHLVVGTPGRVLDHLMNRTMNLTQLRMLILDEADRMLSIGFYPDMKEVQRYLPKNRVPVHFISATFPPQVLRVAKEFMPKPELLSLSHSQVHVTNMDHIFYEVDRMNKDRVLVRVLEMESPTSAIIFCNTKSNVHYVTAVLKGFGYNADELSSDLSQNLREQVLASLRKGQVRFLVATDVAARGIDIPALSHVVLYEPPEDHESYIHRAGRTGRAGAGGTVISLVDIMEKMELQRIAKHYKIDLIERRSPDEQTLAQVVGERLTSLLEAHLRKLPSLTKERLNRFLPLAASLAEDKDSAVLLAMLLDEQYQNSLHAPLAAPQAAPAQERGSEESDSRKRGNHDRRPSGRREQDHKNRADAQPAEAAPAGKRNERVVREEKPATAHKQRTEAPAQKQSTEAPAQKQSTETAAAKQGRRPAPNKNKTKQEQPESVEKRAAAPEAVLPQSKAKPEAAKPQPTEENKQNKEKNTGKNAPQKTSRIFMDAPVIHEQPEAPAKNKGRPGGRGKSKQENTAE